MYPTVGSTVHIQSYKHNGTLHRTWCKGFVLEADEDHIVAVTDHAWVIEADNRKWLTREPAVCFFYRDKWYNIISMIRHSGIYYYCNLASPTIYDGEAIKNIDYDLDVKLYPDRSYQVLDENEYFEHAKTMNYPDEVMDIVEAQMEKLIQEMEMEASPFRQEVIETYYRKYLKMMTEHK